MIKPLNFCANVYKTKHVAKVMTDEDEKEIQKFADELDADVFVYNSGTYYDGAHVYAALVSAEGCFWHKEFDMKYPEANQFTILPNTRAKKQGMQYGTAEFLSSLKNVFFEKDKRAFDNNCMPYTEKGTLDRLKNGKLLELRFDERAYLYTAQLMDKDNDSIKHVQYYRDEDGKLRQMLVIKNFADIKNYIFQKDGKMIVTNDIGQKLATVKKKGSVAIVSQTYRNQDGILEEKFTISPLGKPLDFRV